MDWMPLPLPGVKKSRLAWILVQVGLVLFSSTEMAGQAAEYAFQFYRSITGMSAGAGVHLFAEKGVHFALFFSLGVILYYSLLASRWERVFWVLVACVAVGCASESLQFLFPHRDPLLTDVLLNGGSGLLAAVLLALAPTAAATRGNLPVIERAPEQP